MAKYKVGKVSLGNYIRAQRESITSMENWHHKTEFVTDSIEAAAPDIPRMEIRKAVIREMKQWGTPAQEVIKRLFTEE